MHKHRIRYLVLTLALVAAACTTAMDTAMEDSLSPDTTVDKALAPEQVEEVTTSQPLLGDEPSKESNRILGRRRGPQLQFLSGGSDRNGQYYVDGTTVSLVFGGNLGPIEEDNCFMQLEADTNETASTVEVSLFSLFAAEPPQNEDCSLEEIFSEFAFELDEPLGDRVLISKPSGKEILVSNVADKRSPTLLPLDWEAGETTTYNQLMRQQFGPVHVETYSPFTRSFDRIEGLQNNVNHEMVMISRDLEAVWIPRANGTQRLSFVWDNWFYDIVADPDVERDELVEFARNFERSN